MLLPLLKKKTFKNRQSPNFFGRHIESKCFSVTCPRKPIWGGEGNVTIKIIHFERLYEYLMHTYLGGTVLKGEKLIQQERKKKKVSFFTSRGTDLFLHFIVIQSNSPNCYNSILSGKSVSV